MESDYEGGERRPIATRDKPIWKRAASALARRGASPNAISVAGMFLGVAGGAALYMTSQLDAQPARWAWFAGAFLTQMRLLANMLDGMVAIESGRTSPLGELYNEIPDRVSDVATLVGLGYAAMSDATLGWLAACMAVVVAYVRAQGKAAGAHHEFCGPMAKPHRMFTVTAAAKAGRFPKRRWGSSS